MEYIPLLKNNFEQKNFYYRLLYVTIFATENKLFKLLKGVLIMNRKELVEAIQKQKGLEHLTKKEVDTIVWTWIETIKKSVKKGNDVSMVGFGSFSKARRNARTGVNPSTGEKIRIKARNVVKFRPGKSFKDML